MANVKLRFLAGIFLISSATLCLEITLTRYFSISQQYHFAFWVISIAFLGYGASGSFLALLRKAGSLNQNRFLSSSSLLFSLSILLSFLLCNSLPFDFVSLSWDKGQIYLVLLYYLFLCLPFFFAGLTISFAITTSPAFINRIYFSDLLGAGAGTLLTAIIFLPRGDRGVMVSISLLALVASFLFSRGRTSLFRVLLFSLMAVEVSLFIFAPSWLGFKISPFKALPLAMKYPHAEHLFTRWNAASRIDVIDSPAVRYAPGLSLLYDKPLPRQLGLSSDGGELTAITRFSSPHSPELEFLSFLPSSLAYSILQAPRTLIIKPQGGLDVLASIANHASLTKVIENNPLIIKILREELSSFSGNLYQREDVSPVSSFPRAALQKEKEDYNLIVFSLSDIFGSSSSGLYGFGENYLYTIESCLQILERLTSPGMVSMSLYLLPPPRQEIRALATWIEALERSGRNPASHLLVIRSWGTISFFIKKNPIQDQDIRKMKDFAENRLLDLVYYPGIKREEANRHNKFEKPLYYEIVQKLLDPEGRKDFYRHYLFDIKPVTDDCPFFYNFFKLSKLGLTYQALGRRWLPFLQGKLLVFMLFLQAIVIAFVLIFLPLLALRKKRIKSRSSRPKVFLYFSLIGMAFIYVEIILIQKFILFLGHPLYSVSIIIFSLLFSAGLGSYFSKKILGSHLIRNLRFSLVFCAGFICLFLWMYPVLYRNLVGLGLTWKMLITLAAIFPFGFLMGFPFPSGIRLLERKEKGIIPWAWATNAFSSVINSVSALILAFSLGYNLVLLLAAGAYLLTLPFLGFSSHRDEPNT